jgi:hypothetical protein
MTDTNNLERMIKRLTVKPATEESVQRQHIEHYKMIVRQGPSGHDYNWAIEKLASNGMGPRGEPLDEPLPAFEPLP